MTLKKSETADVGGTSLQGYVYATYDKLVETFGFPSHDGDGYKIDAEWVLTTGDGGVVVTIYNWKNGPNYCGTDGTPVEEITEWHIGGRSELAVEVVSNAIPTAKTTKGWY